MAFIDKKEPIKRFKVNNMAVELMEYTSEGAKVRLAGLETEITSRELIRLEYVARIEEKLKNSHNIPDIHEAI